MYETLMLGLAGIAGAVLGAIFFGGLWWTVRKTIRSKQPALWLLASMLLRTSIALAGFYLVGQGHWERLLLCLSGFIVARLVVTALTRSPQPSGPQGGVTVSAAAEGHAREAAHAH
jgi:F1F0 ATPase subunit 2